MLTFLSKPHWNSQIRPFILDPLSFPMFFPLFILSLGAIFFGYFTHEMFLSLGNTFYFNNLFTHPNHLRLFDGSLSQPSLFKFIISFPIL